MSPFVKPIAFLSALLFFLLLSLPAPAGPNTLKVAFSEHEPWKILDRNGRPDGIDIRLLRTMAEEMGLELRFAHYPFKRGLKMLETGEIDLMVGVLRRPDREAYLHFIEPPYKNSSNKAFFVRKGDEGRIRTYEDLYSLRIGTGLGAKYFPRFDHDRFIDKHPVSDPDLNIRMLLAERVDAFVMTESTGEFRVAQQGKLDEISKAEYVHRESQGVYMVLSKSSRLAGRIGEFNQTMRKLVEAGAMDAIKQRFYEDLAQQ